ncbi:MAG TPA: UDP-N-acetylglucosamine--N-acetylmuramyl-(pentapeptide) pyrophosphoryl-undecaprenol N-acetylglucosamine transferase [Longimicrobiales bacterium]|nr:UDP-N-acetylglucosamine--N-acetylmuramyl-(pentapeptide) pyrophosphoryl-undecaprenol N-acetylglucosamine transferase [Longimicrobiales bacterium]
MHELARTVVVFSGGGTGGHLYPALALAEALVALRPDVRPFFVGAARGVEARVLPERRAEHVLLPVQGFQRGRGLGALRALPALAVSVVRTARLFRRLRPEAVVVTGGYAGGPAGMVAGALRIPLVLQEQNAVPGVTTRLLSRWARRIHVAFPEAVALLPGRARQRTVVSGNPVRPASLVAKGEARKAFGLPQEGSVVLVVGGSQGSIALNRLLLEAVAGVVRGELTRPEGVTVLWSTGPGHHAAVQRALDSVGAPGWVRAVGYIQDMPIALAAADLAVSRAGAMATAELLNQGLPAILVPLPTAAADHQSMNAEALAHAGAAVVAREEGLTGAGLWAHVVDLACGDSRRVRMVAAARERARPTAATEIAADIAALLPGSGR